MTSLRFKLEHLEVCAQVGAPPPQSRSGNGVADALKRHARRIIKTVACCFCAGALLIVAAVMILPPSSRPALHAAEVGARPPPTPPPPPDPPASPPRPAAPAASHVVAASACLVRTAGVLLTAVANGFCQDGGVGSTSSECRLGTDFPDCPARYEWLPLPPPPVPTPPQTWVAVPVVFEVLVL